METIKNLSVQMNFTLNFENVEVTESIKEQLLELFNNGKTLSNDKPNIGFEEVGDWLSEQINYHEGTDCFGYQIEWIE